MKREPKTLLEKLDFVLKRVGAIPKNMRDLTRAVRSLQKRMHELELQMGNLNQELRERRLVGDIPEDVRPVSPPPQPYQPVVPYGGGTVMYGVVDITSTPGTGSWASDTITITNWDQDEK